MTGKKYDSLEDRLLANSYLCLETGCWIFFGSVHPRGYGQMSFRKGAKVVSLFAHRVAYEVFTGNTLAEGDTVDHLCRNKLCINPAHLEPVSRSENTRRARAAHAAASSDRKSKSRDAS